ncbi:hypothetical protein GQ55_9G596400 [Panicum hallii var. hallii]|uniref:Uncharacterized protein n=1 Tax=Panicum hallii var. hallii TaxID=1504633 RepID=A0A2T7CH09_9POAL|nr:hypothetical protein GQ55_9G596400 [Panicum hallii var. hallii]
MANRPLIPLLSLLAFASICLDPRRDVMFLSTQGPPRSSHHFLHSLNSEKKRERGHVVHCSPNDSPPRFVCSHTTTAPMDMLGRATPPPPPPPPQVVAKLNVTSREERAHSLSLPQLASLFHCSIRAGLVDTVDGGGTGGFLGTDGLPSPAPSPRFRLTPPPRLVFFPASPRRPLPLIVLPVLSAPRVCSSTRSFHTEKNTNVLTLFRKPNEA